MVISEKETKIYGTRILEANFGAYYSGKRRALNEGGTSSSKTYSILQILIIIARSSRTQKLISIVSESLPHLKRGCIRDFMNIMGAEFDDKRYNKSEQTYNFGNCVVEFFPADDPAKMRGGRRDILFINECNNVSYNSFMELDKRTKQFTFLDWNPVSEFWVHEKRMKEMPENEYIHSTYLDANVGGTSVLPREVVDNIEVEKHRDPNWWHIYGLGLLGKIEGLVYQVDFGQVDTLPAGRPFYGLDFGFSSDPTVLEKNVVVGDQLYSKELFYDRSGLTNDQIGQAMVLLGITDEPIYADPSQPQSIEEIRQLGFNIKEAVKGKGSVEFGIKAVNQYYQHWTSDSPNCIKEQRNCRYIEDRITGVLTDKITHTWSHGMDARRYGVSSHSFGTGRPRVKTAAWRF